MNPAAVEQLVDRRAEPPSHRHARRMRPLDPAGAAERGEHRDARVPVVAGVTPERSRADNRPALAGKAQPVCRRSPCSARDGIPVTTGAVDARLPLASVTKTLVTYAVLVAVEEGSLDLDAPLDADAGTSLRHLLAHASGMAPDERTLVAPPCDAAHLLECGLRGRRRPACGGDGHDHGGLPPRGRARAARDGRDDPRRLTRVGGGVERPPTSPASRPSCSRRR